MRDVYKSQGLDVDATGPPEPALGYLLDWWADLSLSRAGGFGASAITYVEIEAWARLTDRYLSAREVEMIRRLDAKFLDIHNAKD